MKIDISHCRIAVIGAGRLGTALVQALHEAQVAVYGPIHRDEQPPADSDVILLCVADSEIAASARSVAPGPLIGHCAGALSLDCLAPHRRTFSLHPLMTVAAGSAGALAGAAAAVDGHDEDARQFARDLAHALQMQPFSLADDDRAAYHAAASFAANFLITIEAAAEQLAGTAGVPRELLVPLVRASVDNWAALGGNAAMTGPVARGDLLTVARQRDAVAERTPHLLALFDELCAVTRTFATPVEAVA